MSISGKLIGGTLGCLIGGPLGGILGVAIGHSFDKTRSTASNGSEPLHGRRREYQQNQMTFFVAAFSMLGKMAAADGNVSDSERDTVRAFMQNELHLSLQDQNFAMRIFDTAAASGETFDKFAQQFYECFMYEPQMIDMMMDILVRLCFADGTLSEREGQFIARAAMCFRYPAGNVENLKIKYGYRKDDAGSSGSRNNYQADPDGDLGVAYSVLGCSPSDADDVVKSRYKKLIKEYHPDIIASKGLPEEFTEFANKKFNQIQQAYETIKKVRKL